MRQEPPHSGPGASLGILGDPAIEPSSGQESRPARPKRPPLSPSERKAIDARTAAILDQHGIECRPPTETSLVVINTGAIIALDETKENWTFAKIARCRAARTALEFDAFRQQADLRHLRHYVLRPLGRKALPGELAGELRRFSDDLNCHVGRLVSRGYVKPLLTTIHLRFDQTLGMWDVHAHCLWQVQPTDLDAVWKVVGHRFSDAWREEDRIRNASALANYTLTWVVDHRSLENWSDECLLELWDLSGCKLIRPAGAFAKFRRTLRGKIVRREGDAITVEDRIPRARPVKRREGPSQTIGGDGVVAYATVRLDGQDSLCAVVKRPRQGRPADEVRRNEGDAAERVLLRARPMLAYGENQANSSAILTPVGSLPGQAILHHEVPLSKPSRFDRADRHAGMRPRHWWMAVVWPKVGVKVPRPIRRRLFPMAAQGHPPSGRRRNPGQLCRPEG